MHSERLADIKATVKNYRCTYAGNHGRKVAQLAVMDLLDEIATLTAERDALKAEAEAERLRLAACGVAAMQNTETSAQERITRDNPHWSASYGDVCGAVDREMALRAEVARLKEELDYLIDELAKYKPRKMKLNEGN